MGEWRKAELSTLGDFISGSGFPLEYQGMQDGIIPFFKVSDLNNLGNETFLELANNYGHL